jgi:hypothetical protein
MLIKGLGLKIIPAVSAFIATIFQALGFGGNRKKGISGSKT